MHGNRSAVKSKTLQEGMLGPVCPGKESIQAEIRPACDTVLLHEADRLQKREQENSTAQTPGSPNLGK